MEAFFQSYRITLKLYIFRTFQVSGNVFLTCKDHIYILLATLVQQTVNKRGDINKSVVVPLSSEFQIISNSQNHKPRMKLLINSHTMEIYSMLKSYPAYPCYRPTMHISTHNVAYYQT